MLAVKIAGSNGVSNGNRIVLKINTIAITEPLDDFIETAPLKDWFSFNSTSF